MDIASTKIPLISHRPIANENFLVNGILRGAQYTLTRTLSHTKYLKRKSFILEWNISS